MFSIYNLTAKILHTNKTVIQFLRVDQMLIRKMNTLNDFHSVYINLNLAVNEVAQRERLEEEFLD